MEVASRSLNLGGRIYSNSMTTILSVSNKFFTGVSERRDIDIKNSESDTKTGGNAIVPAVTIHTNSWGPILGGTASYFINGERTFKYIRSDSVRTEKATDGNVQRGSLFIENSIKKMKLGGALDYVKIEASKYKSDTGSTSEGSALAYASASVFLSFDVTDKLRFTPSVTYGQFGEGMSSNVDKKDIFSASVIGIASF